MQAYYYISKKEKEDVLNCGIKLSAKSDRSLSVDGYSKPCISTLLNPKDDIKKYKSTEYVCLRLELKDEYCYIANKELYGDEMLSNLYISSIVSSKNYVFGTYRMPECLIACTILPENIQVKNKIIDFPILYDNSVELYINNLVSEMKENYTHYEEISVGLFLDKLATIGEFDRLEKDDLIIYSNKHRQEVYTIKKYHIQKNG